MPLIQIAGTASDISGIASVTVRYEFLYGDLDSDGILFSPRTPLSHSGSQPPAHTTTQPTSAATGGSRPSTLS